jgi:hypothetical protein
VRGHVLPAGLQNSFFVAHAHRLAVEAAFPVGASHDFAGGNAVAFVDAVTRGNGFPIPPENRYDFTA